MRKSVFASLVIALPLAACGSPKDASNHNFEKAINAHFDRKCIEIEPGLTSSPSPYPVSVPIKDFTIPRYDALVKAGLLSVKDGSIKETGPFSSGETVPAKIYNLTDTGKKALADPKGTALCVGKYKVDTIERFTPPAPSPVGPVMSQVAYTFSPTDVPDWAKSPGVLQAFPPLKEGLAEHQKGDTMLILASDGWIEGRDFSR